MGGVVRSVSLLSEGLAETGQDVTVFTTNANPLGKDMNIRSHNEYFIKGVKVNYFSVKYFKKKYFYSPELKKELKKSIKNYDLIHINAFWSYPGKVGAKLARKHNIPYIISPRGTFDDYSLSKKKIKKQLYRRLFENKIIKNASAVHYTTELEKESSPECVKLNKKDFIVPNPVPVEEFKVDFDKKAAREYLDIPEESKVISYIGRLHKRKALDVLIESFKIISNKIDSCHLIIAGPDDGYKKKLMKLACKNGNKENIHFKGYVGKKDKNYILKASDLFWLASYPGENFGHSAVEALAMGVPLVISK
ncbi:MAG: glycosyltransferase, partial [Atribacterota bacterium]